METSLYSVRMRASSAGRHLTGAERIVPGAVVSDVTADLTRRAMCCPQGRADHVNCSIEQIDPATVCYAVLPVLSTVIVKDWSEGRRAAHRLLVRAGVQADVAAAAITLLAKGAGPDGAVMRGAVLMDAANGARLELNPARGVRVSRMDLVPEFRPVMERRLAEVGLAHHRVLEALILSGKVLGAPGVIAELCWSDAPDYTTGYVADPQFGYQRITALKPVGDWRGGRIFFINRADCSPAGLIDYLERKPVLFKGAGAISPPRNWISSNE
jgi:6-carboxyhexanoate--CoA ligase